MDGWMDGQMQMDGWLDNELMNKWVDELMNKLMK